MNFKKHFNEKMFRKVFSHINKNKTPYILSAGSISLSLFGIYNITSLESTLNKRRKEMKGSRDFFDKEYVHEYLIDFDNNKFKREKRFAFFSFLPSLLCGIINPKLRFFNIIVGSGLGYYVGISKELYCVNLDREKAWKINEPNFHGGDFFYAIKGLDLF